MVSGGVEGRVYGLKLDRGEFAEAALSSSAVAWFLTVVATLSGSDGRDQLAEAGRRGVPV